MTWSFKTVGQRERISKAWVVLMYTKVTVAGMGGVLVMTLFLVAVAGRNHPSVAETKCPSQMPFVSLEASLDLPPDPSVGRR